MRLKDYTDPAVIAVNSSDVDWSAKLLVVALEPVMVTFAVGKGGGEDD